MDISPAMDAIRAVGISQSVTANNIANVGTEGFEPSRVRFADGPGGVGVQVQSIRQDSPGGGLSETRPVPDGTDALEASTGRAASGTDLSREFVGLIQNGAGSSANLASVSAYEQLTGTVMDMKV